MSTTHRGDSYCWLSSIEKMAPNPIYIYIYLSLYMYMYNIYIYTHIINTLLLISHEVSHDIYKSSPRIFGIPQAGFTRPKYCLSRLSFSSQSVAFLNLQAVKKGRAWADGSCNPYFWGILYIYIYLYLLLLSLLLSLLLLLFYYSM